MKLSHLLFNTSLIPTSFFTFQCQEFGHYSRDNIDNVGALSHVSTHEYIHTSVHVALSQLGHMTVLYHYSDNL